MKALHSLHTLTHLQRVFHRHWFHLGETSKVVSGGDKFILGDKSILGGETVLTCQSLSRGTGAWGGGPPSNTWILPSLFILSDLSFSFPFLFVHPSDVCYLPELWMKQGEIDKIFHSWVSKRASAKFLLIGIQSLFCFIAVLVSSIICSFTNIEMIGKPQQDSG